MKNLIKVINLFLIILFMTGCSKAIIKSDSDPNTNLAELKKFYVQKLPADERGLEKIIAGKLNEFGFQATSGIDAAPADPVDVVVTYKDRWMWDITMYMLEINIEFHNPDSRFVFASGKSYRTSLVRKSPEEMIDEVLRDMFAGKVDLPEKKVDDKKKE
jgi:hypothetical protein